MASPSSAAREQRATGANRGGGPLWFRLADQWLLGAAGVLAILALAGYCWRAGQWSAERLELERRAEPMPEQVFEYKIDPNTADWVQWMGLPGIGPVLAKRIVEDRTRNGKFRNLDELRRVSGIGPKKIEAIREFVRLEQLPEP